MSLKLWFILKNDENWGIYNLKYFYLCLDICLVYCIQPHSFDSIACLHGPKWNSSMWCSLLKIVIGDWSKGRGVAVQLDNIRSGSSCPGQHLHHCHGNHRKASRSGFPPFLFGHLENQPTRFPELRQLDLRGGERMTEITRVQKYSHQFIHKSRIHIACTWKYYAVVVISLIALIINYWNVHRRNRYCVV